MADVSPKRAAVDRSAGPWPQPVVAPELPPRRRRQNRRAAPPAVRGHDATVLQSPPPATAIPPPKLDGAAVEAPVAPEPVRDPARKQVHDTGELRARKVRRIVRHVDPWSVLKLSLLFYFCLYLTLMVAGVLLWSLAAASGTIEDFEGFIADLGAFRTFEFDSGRILVGSGIGGLILVVAGAGFNTLIAVLFNLISDLVGGLRITVIEEETARRVSVGS